ncbi:MAG: DUF1800 domain-containing protein [Pseudomonadales bacterium]|nr:DUF1800 domain-containing protein [Pseudomonadales bacterium]
MRLNSDKSCRVILLAVLILLPIIACSDTADDTKAVHLLNRLAFGPAQGDLNSIKFVGINTYIEQQLHPELIPLPTNLTAHLEQLDTLQLDPFQLYKAYGPPPVNKGAKPDPQTVKEARQRAHIIVMQAAEARLARAIESPRQLQEVMVEFWYNHFNVFAGKGLDNLWIGAYEEEVIRPHVLGRFSDLLDATAKHPAMLFYLDNWLNTAPDSPGARGKFDGINENYARELMELHTLGVHGGYTQQDVTTLAQILTGWGFRRGGNMEFFFDSRRHDFKDKQFLGQKIKGSGEQEVQEALDILARSPATAQHISYELSQYFVSDTPNQALVDKLAKRFMDTDGDIRKVLDTLFHSKEFWDAKNYGNKFKTPYEYIVSAARASGVDVQNYRPLMGALQQLGQPLYGCLTPNGYQNTQAVWLNPDAMMRRINFATLLSAGRLAAKQPMSPPPVVSVNVNLIEETLGSELSPLTLSIAKKAPEMLRPALIFGSPEFMYR